MAVTRVVLADDHAAVRAGVRKILQRNPDIEVVGEACNGVEAIHLVNQLAPDVLLLDMEMPVLNGVEVAHELYAAHSPVRILALSAYEDKQYIIELVTHGAAGYMTKDEVPYTLAKAILSVANGEGKWFSQRVAAKVAGYFAQKG